MTPAALSHQIRRLENMLGVKLFHRKRGSLQLTPAGEVMAPKVRRGFEYLDNGIRRLGEDSSGKTLSLWAPPSLSSHWLIPRLSGFYERHRDCDIRLINRWVEAEFAEGGYDAELVFNDQTGALGHDQEIELFSAYMLPVLSPDLHRKLGNANDLSIFGKATRIQNSMGLGFGGPQWSDWFESCGWEDPGSKRFQTMGTSAHVVQAAVSGNGIALVRLCVAWPLLSNGTLVAPFDSVLKCPAPGVRFCISGANRNQPKVKRFTNWIRAEATRYEEEISRFLAERNVVETLSESGRVSKEQTGNGH